MITVTVHKFGNFPVSVKKIRGVVKKILQDYGIASLSEASIAIVGRDKMREYVDKYYKDGLDHPVLSFPNAETRGQFAMPPDGIIHLGEIIVSYHWAVDEAQKRDKLIEEVLLDLAAHGALHLVGIHHD